MKKIFIFSFAFFIFLSNSSYFSYSYDDDLINDEETLSIIKTIETSSAVGYEPNVNSKYIIALDRNTKRILYEKSGFNKTPMASTTKILTAIIAIEKCDLNEIVNISSNAAHTTGSTLGISTNEKISMKDLLYGLMLRSGNDCAVAIAEHISGNLDNFSKLMNLKCKELGLENSNFVTPHGLDNPDHYTTAYDLALLTDYALQNETFLNIVKTKETTIKNGSLHITNTNELLGNYPGIYGVKTGFTFGAGRCLVSSCKKDNLDIIVVVLRCNNKNYANK